MGRRSVYKSLKARTLVSCILFIILLILLLSTTAQATEYREVKAEEILKQIEYGEDVNYTDCHIIGELNTSNITLKTVPNPYYYELVNEGRDKKYVVIGITENLCVIESNIIIKNSIFKESLNFSNVLFNGSVEFEGTNFSNSADFTGVNFNNSADFIGTKFTNSANFNGTNFSSSANFSYANFDGNIHFKWAKFLGPANFNRTNFNDFAVFYHAKFLDPADFVGAILLGTTSFWEANFNSSANFSSAKFKNGYTSFQKANFNSDVNFSSANFNGRTEFKGANFRKSTHFCSMTINSSVDFTGPETSNSIITDNDTRHIFVKYYTNEARFDDADNIYYNYRERRRELANYSERSKWEDSAGLISWGYGVRPWNTVGVAIAIIFVFVPIYKNPNLTVRRNGKKIIIRFNWGEPGIYRKGENGIKPITSNWEFLYFSVNIFTRLGSADWHQRDGFRRWVTIEAFLGWLLLALLFATTAAHPRFY